MTQVIDFICDVTREVSPSSASLSVVISKPLVTPVAAALDPMAGVSLLVRELGVTGPLPAESVSPSRRQALKDAVHHLPPSELHKHQRAVKHLASHSWSALHVQERAAIMAAACYLPLASRFTFTVHLSHLKGFLRRHFKIGPGQLCEIDHFMKLLRSNLKKAGLSGFEVVVGLEVSDRHSFFSERARVGRHVHGLICIKDDRDEDTLRGLVKKAVLEASQLSKRERFPTAVDVRCWSNYNPANWGAYITKDSRCRTLQEPKAMILPHEMMRATRPAEERGKALFRSVIQPLAQAWAERLDLKPELSEVA